MIARPVLLQLLSDAVAPTTSEDNDENDVEKVENDRDCQSLRMKVGMVMVFLIQLNE